MTSSTDHSIGEAEHAQDRCRPEECVPRATASHQISSNTDPILRSLEAVTPGPSGCAASRADRCS